MTINTSGQSLEVPLNRDTVTYMNPILGKVFVRNKDGQNHKINYGTEVLMQGKGVPRMKEQVN